MKPERTIEELLEYTTAQIEAMTEAERDAWIGDAITAQEEILKKVPKRNMMARDVVNIAIGGKTRAAQVKARDTMALVPDSIREGLTKMQAQLEQLRSKGVKI